MLLITEDGLSFAAAAAAAGGAVAERRVYLEDAPERLRATLTGASVGDLRGPVSGSGC